MGIAIAGRVVAAIRRRPRVMAAEGRGEGTGPGALALRCSEAAVGSFGGGGTCRDRSGIAQAGIAVVTGDGLRTGYG